MTKKIAAVVLIAALVLGGGAYAVAQESGAQGSGDTAAAQDRAQRRHHRARAIHADLLVRRDGEWVTVTLDRGTVEGEVAGTVTVVRRDGESVTKEVSDDTRVRGAGPDGEVVAGEPALVVSRGDAATLVAQRRR